MILNAGKEGPLPLSDCRPLEPDEPKPDELKPR